MVIVDNLRKFYEHIEQLSNCKNIVQKNSVAESFRPTLLRELTITLSVTYRFELNII